jgi:type IV pilus assembly protein PilO
VPLLPTSQRDQAKVAAGLVAVALAVYYWMYPYAAKQTDFELREARLEKLEAANAKARRESRRGRAQELAAEAARFGATLEEMRRLVPTENEVPALLEEVSTAARRAGLELGGVSPEPVVRGPDFDTYRYKVTVVGGYHALTEFLANVGSLPRIVAPVTFTLAAQSSPAAKTARVAAATPALQATVTVQTYVAHTPAPSPDARAGASAGEALPSNAANGALDADADSPDAAPAEVHP